MPASAQPCWPASSVQGTAIGMAFPTEDVGWSREISPLLVHSSRAAAELWCHGKQVLAVSRGGTEQPVMSLPPLPPVLPPTSQSPGS